jgi:ABC-type Fe3+-hydroxamate transport system substrate-binding protein
MAAPVKTSVDYSARWQDAGGVWHDRTPHRRIVSLAPSLTETLCALGGRQYLAGCTAFCIRPAGLFKDPLVSVVGGTKTLMKERILGLNPDLLMFNLEENTLSDIDYFKPRVECFIDGTRTLDEGLRGILEVGALIGAGNLADTLYQDGQSRLNAIRARVAERDATGAPRPKLFYAIWREPWMTANHDTFIHDHLCALGAENVFAQEASSRYPVVTMEQIRAAAPDIVWLPSEPYRFKAKHAAEFSNLKDLPAAQYGRVELTDGDAACWFGAHQLEGMGAMCRQLWGKNPGDGPLPLDFRAIRHPLDRS